MFSPTSPENEEETFESEGNEEPEQKFSGLKNLGPVNFYNSVLQILFHISTFRRAVFKLDLNPYDLKDIALNLQKLFGCLQLFDGDTCSPAQLISAMDLDLPINQIQDVDSFLKMIFESVSDKMEYSYSEFIDSLFECEITQHIDYYNIGSQQETTDNIYGLSVEIDDGSLEDSLDTIFEPKQYSGDEQSEIEHDKEDAIYTTKISVFPKVLLIHLKRFEGIQKDSSRFQYTKNLSLLKYADSNVDVSDTHYTLYGVLVHSGSNSQETGLFYCYLKPFPCSDWYQFQDSYVQSVNEFHAIEKNYGDNDSSTTAIMLVYIKSAVMHDVLFDVDATDIPHYISDYVYQLKDKEREEEEQRIIEMNTIHARLLKNSDIQKAAAQGSIRFNATGEFDVMKNDSMDVVIQKALNSIELEDQNAELFYIYNSSFRRMGYTDLVEDNCTYYVFPISDDEQFEKLVFVFVYDPIHVKVPIRFVGSHNYTNQKNLFSFAGCQGRIVVGSTSGHFIELQEENYIYDGEILVIEVQYDETLKYQDPSFLNEYGFVMPPTIKEYYAMKNRSRYFKCSFHGNDKNILVPPYANAYDLSRSVVHLLGKQEDLATDLAFSIGLNTPFNKYIAYTQLDILNDSNTFYFMNAKGLSQSQISQLVPIHISVSDSQMGLLGWLSHKELIVNINDSVGQIADTLSIQSDAEYRPLIKYPRKKLRLCNPSVLISKIQLDHLVFDKIQPYSILENEDEFLIQIESYKSDERTEMSPPFLMTIRHNMRFSKVIQKALSILKKDQLLCKSFKYNNEVFDENNSDLVIPKENNSNIDTLTITFDESSFSRHDAILRTFIE